MAKAAARVAISRMDRPAIDTEDLRSRNESTPLDLGNLRREMAKQPVASPARATRTPQKNQRLSQTWAINLERNEQGIYLFSFREDLEQALEPNQPRQH